MSRGVACIAPRLRLSHVSRRTFSTTTSEGSSAPSKQWRPKENVKVLHPRMIFVRPWDGIPTMAHAFAIVREIEKRFGKIQEFVVIRDADVWTTNMPYMHATFAKAEYTDAIPLEGRVIQVPMPAVDPLRDGGVGLDDLEAYLNPTERADDAATSKPAELGAGPQVGIMMDVKLERSGLREPPPVLDHILAGRGRPQGAPLLRKPDRAREFRAAMLAFGGGFAPAPPNESESTKRPRRRLVAEKWNLMEEEAPAAVGVAAEPSGESAGGSSSPSYEPEPIPWKPFPDDGLMTKLEATRAQSDSGPSIPLNLTSSGTVLPPSELSSGSSAPPPLLSSSPTSSSSSTFSQHPSRPNKAPKLSKKQRMLQAVRAAGANAAAENDYGTLQEPQPQPTTTVEGVDPADSSKQDEDNKKAAGRWWKFLTGSG